MNKLRQSAKGQECTLQIHPWCNGNPETTVLAHLPSAKKGMGLKSPDWFAVFACSACHDIIDRRRRVDISEVELINCQMRALYRTHKIWIDEGLLKV